MRSTPTLVKARVYCASKAAIHFFCISLREQLRGRVRVTELIPPPVETNLHRHQERKPQAMPLKDFIDEAMRGLDGDSDEVAAGRAKALRFGSGIAPKQFLKIINKSAAA